MTNQPEWKCVANLGDATPWDYGGAFVMVDQTGVYCPELWLFDADDEPVTEYQVLLEPCTYRNGILSDNKYHPEYQVWFGEPERIASMARSADLQEQELLDDFCSDDPIERAHAYRVVCDHYGAFKFDQYPIFHKKRVRMQMMQRMKKWLRQAGELQ